jgi:hypothetical protein
VWLQRALSRQGSRRVINDRCWILVSCGGLDRLQRANLLLPASPLDGGQLFFCHSVAGGEITWGFMFSPIIYRWGFLSSLPDVIFASISTLESAGINSSGSSTRSWIGILIAVSTASPKILRGPLTPVRQLHRVSYCWRHQVSILEWFYPGGGEPTCSC